MKDICVEATTFYGDIYKQQPVVLGDGRIAIKYASPDASCFIFKSKEDARRVAAKLFELSMEK
jgi:hypothetical protein